MTETGTQLTDLQHAKGERSSNMYLGSKKNQKVETWILNKNKFEDSELEYPPALYKIIDEVFVNAIDHHTDFPKLVKKIDIKLDSKGMIEVYNDGPGIPVEEVKNASGVKMYNPELIASQFRSGVNFKKRNRTKGGVNGLGLKLTNAFSDYMKLETYDSNNKVLYTQEFFDRLERVEKPVLQTKKLTKEQKIPHTKITFLPSYDEFKFKLNKNNLKTLDNIIYSRCYHAAACVSADIYYNDKLVNVKGFNEYVGLFLPDISECPRVSFSIESKEYKEYKLVWDICIAPSDDKFQQVSIVNGMVMLSGGNHIKHIQNLIVDELKPKITKELPKNSKFNKNIIINNIFIFMIGRVVDANFSGQRKDKLDNPIKEFESFKIKKTDYIRIWEVLKEHILYKFTKKDNKTNRVIRGTVKANKYQPAKFAGHKTKFKKCGLFVSEGDSADGTVNAGITDRNNSLNYDYWGRYSIQGVIVNAQKEHKEMKIKGKKVLIPTPKFKNSERIQTLFKILNLDPNKKYKTNDDFNTLRYGFVVVATDQDEDGKGQIFGLVVNLFMILFPELVKRGYIKRLNTPIVRVYPKIKSKKYKVKNFYTVPQYEEWKKNNDISKYKEPSYYKGLASHDPKETKNMFSDVIFNKMVHTYFVDEEAFEKIRIYFGHDTTNRKIALSTPVDKIPSEGPNISITEQLDIDTKSYQRDNIIRKLPHICDGLVQSRRKVMFTARNVFGKTNTTNNKITTAVLASNTIIKANYHHGDASLQDTIVRLAQNYIGGRFLPYLTPKGNCGSYPYGGKDHGQSRYVKVKLNQRLTYQVFPSEDDYLLPYIEEDGKRVEPKYYVGVLPVSIMENMSLPGTGWKICVYARHYKDVIDNVRNLILKNKKPKKMKIFIPGCHESEYKKVLCDKKTQQYSIGQYKKGDNSDELIITRMPIECYSGLMKEPFGNVNKDKKDSKRYWINKDEIDTIQDNTTADGKFTEVIIQFRKDGLKYVLDNYGNEYFDPIIDYLDLKQSLKANINMIDENYCVKEYKSYEEVLLDWFEIRKNLYIDRINREIILTELRILYYKNLIKFNKNYESYNINNKIAEEKAIKILSDEKYHMFNKTLLDNPKYTKNEDLVYEIMENKNNISYNYLLDLSIKRLTKKFYQERIDKIKELEDYLKYLKDQGDYNFIGAKQWLEEIDRLEETITLGIKYGWDYSEDEVEFE